MSIGGKLNNPESTGQCRFFGSIAIDCAARRRQLVGRKSDLMNTSQFLIALTVEVSIPNLANAKQDATSACFQGT